MKRLVFLLVLFTPLAASAEPIVKNAVTSKCFRVFVNDSSVSTGAGLTGLVFNSAGLTCYYSEESQGGATQITMQTSTLGTYTSGAFKEVDATNMPGIYEFCPPDASLDGGIGTAVTYVCKGATNMAPMNLRVLLSPATDNAAWNGTVLATPDTAGYPKVTVKSGTGTGELSLSSGLVALSGTQTFSNTGTWTGSLTGSVGSVTGAVGSVTGAVGSVTGNVGGNVTGSVGSVVGAVGSVTGAVGSVTGNVGGNVVGNVNGNVVGSVASVTGAVGSVTGNVGGNVVGSVASVTGAVGSVTGNVGGNVVGNVNGNVVGSVGSVAGSIAGSVASVTGSVGSVVGNVGGNVVGSVASVTGAVGSVTGNVGGNVVGSVASVTGNVGGNVVGSVASVTGNVGGNVTGSVGSVAAGGITPTSYSAEIVGHTGTAQTVGANSIQLAASESYADKELNDNATVLITSATTGKWQTRCVCNNVGATDTVTLCNPWKTTPTGTVKYAIIPTPNCNLAKYPVAH